MNSYTVFWLIIAVVLGVTEVSTINLTTIWFALAAFATAIFAAFGFEIMPQLLIFAVLSAVLVALTRPLAKRLMGKTIVPTNADRIISAKGIVIEEINSAENTGQIKVLGQIWSAKSEDGNNITVGSSVTVTSLEGVRAVVKCAEVLQEA